MATSEDARETTALPAGVGVALNRARQAGFTRSCEPQVGKLLAVLAAGVPSGGRILELGTGVGVGLAWILHGLGGRGDVEVVSVESDQATAAIAVAAEWPTVCSACGR